MEGPKPIITKSYSTCCLRCRGDWSSSRSSDDDRVRGYRILRCPRRFERVARVSQRSPQPRDAKGESIRCATTPYLMQAWNRTEPPPLPSQRAAPTTTTTMPDACAYLQTKCHRHHRHRDFHGTSPSPSPPPLWIFAPLHPSKENWLPPSLRAIETEFLPDQLIPPNRLVSSEKQRVERKPNKLHWKQVYRNRWLNDVSLRGVVKTLRLYRVLQVFGVGLGARVVCSLEKERRRLIGSGGSHDR